MRKKSQGLNEKSLQGLIHFLESKLPRSNWTQVLRKKEARHGLLRAARRTFHRLEQLAARKFSANKPARGVRFLPMSGGSENFLNFGKSFALVWIDGVEGTGFFLLGGTKTEFTFKPGIWFAHRGCPGRFNPKELKDFPDFLLKIWIEAGSRLLRSHQKRRES